MITMSNATVEYPCGHPTGGAPVVISVLGCDRAVRCKLCCLDWPIVERLPDGALVDEASPTPVTGDARPLQPGEVVFPGGGGIFLNDGPATRPRRRRWWRR